MLHRYRQQSTYMRSRGIEAFFRKAAAAQPHRQTFQGSANGKWHARVAFRAHAVFIIIIFIFFY
jgi:hypothetical protein